MPETLAHNWQTLSASVGHYLGFGDDPDLFSDTQAGQVKKALDGGYRRCAFPPNYSWSWMLARRNIVTTTVDVYDYAVPIEIGNVTGALTVATTSTNYDSIKLYHDGNLEQMRTANPSLSGRPKRAAFYSGFSAPGLPATKRIQFWPTPDGTYTIVGKCQLNPIPLTKENPNPLGGVGFSQLLLEACLAEAERQMDDMQGIHNMAYQEQLLAALEQDKRLRSEFMGQMLDPGAPEAGYFMGMGGGQGCWGLSNNFRADYNGNYY